MISSPVFTPQRQSEVFKLVPAEFDMVVFDCDGVLVDSEVLSCTCLGNLLCQHDFEIDLHGVFETFLGRSFATVAEQYRLVKGRPLDPAFAAAHRRTLRAIFEQSLLPMAGVETVLARLTLPFCVASSSDRERLDFSLSITGLARHFGKHVYSADAVARGKPAPDLFLHVAGQMRAEPSRTLVIEDSVMGIRAAKAAGMTAWGFVGGSHYAERDGAGLLREAGADRIFRDMAELPAL